VIPDYGVNELSVKMESNEPHRRVAIGFMGICLLTILVLLAASCSHKSAATAAEDPSTAVVGVSKVTRRDLSQTLRLAAEFLPFQEIDVHAKVAGYVKKIYVDIGDHVRTGQLLAVLEIPELQEEVTEAKDTVSQNEQEIQHAQFELARAKADYQAKHLQFTRLAEVAKSQPNLIAQQEIDDAMSKDQAAAAEVDAAQAALASAKEQLRVATDNQHRVQAMYGYAHITAPFDGVITKRYADTGAMIQAGTASHTQAMPLVRLSQNNLLRLTIPVPESEVPYIHVGMPASVEVPSIGKTYAGKVVRFAQKVDFSTRTMTTEIDVPNPRLELVPGMYAYASLVLERRPNVLSVPVQALDRQGNLVTVVRVDANNKLERVSVQLGLETPDQAEVLSGLRSDDMVVVSARTQLKNGESVQPKVLDLTAPQGQP
jgi:RND family efflux transporter MFP subunit